jgi:hypothetical protein
MIWQQLYLLTESNLSWAFYLFNGHCRLQPGKRCFGGLVYCWLLIAREEKHGERVNNRHARYDQPMYSFSGRSSVQLGAKASSEQKLTSKYTPVSPATQSYANQSAIQLVDDLREPSGHSGSAPNFF